MCTLRQTSAAQGDFVLGLMTLRYQKHWPHCHQFLQKLLPPECSFKQKNIKEIFPVPAQAIRNLPSSAKAAACFRFRFKERNKTLNTRESSRIFLINYLTRSEWKDLWSPWLGSHFSMPKPDPFEALPPSLPFHLTISATSTFETTNCSW